MNNEWVEWYFSVQHWLSPLFVVMLAAAVYCGIRARTVWLSTAAGAVAACLYHPLIEQAVDQPWFILQAALLAGLITFCCLARKRA